MISQLHITVQCMARVPLHIDSRKLANLPVTPKIQTRNAWVPIQPKAGIPRIEVCQNLQNKPRRQMNGFYAGIYFRSNMHMRLYTMLGSVLDIKKERDNINLQTSYLV